MIPERIGPYRLSEQIARGPQSLVALAVDRSGRRVLLKVHENDEALGELAALGVAHPGLSACLDAGRVPGDGRAFTVSEFVDGEPLAPGIDTRLDLEAMAAWLLATCQFVHESLGLLHRDIKADNVLVERATGRPVLIDFGLSVPQERGSDDLSGTPRAMAPELFEGSAATVASDLWAVGLLLAEAGLGRPLFEAESDPVAMAAERRAFAGLAPDDLDALGGGDLAVTIARLLAADPAARPASAAAALAALGPLAPRLTEELDRARASSVLHAALARADRAAGSVRAAVRDGAVWIPLTVDAGASASDGASTVLREVLAWCASVSRPSEALAGRLEAAEVATAPVSWDEVAHTVGALAQHGRTVVHVDGVSTDDHRAQRIAAQNGVKLTTDQALDAGAVRGVLEAWLGESPVLTERLVAAAPLSFGALRDACVTLLTSGAVRVRDGVFDIDEVAIPKSWPQLDDVEIALTDDERDVLSVLAQLPSAALSAPDLRGVLDRAVGGVLERLSARGLVERRRSSPEDLFALVDTQLRRRLVAEGAVAPDVRVRLAEVCAADETARDGGGAIDERSAAAIAQVLGDDVGAPDSVSFTAILAEVAATLRRVGRLGLAASLLRRAIAGARDEPARLTLEVELADVLLRAQRYDDLLRHVDAVRARSHAPAIVVRAARERVLRFAPREALEMLDDALIATLEQDDAVLALQVRSQALQLVGRLDDSLSDVREALRRMGSAPHRRTMVLLERAGALARRLGRPDEAIRRYEECLAMARVLGHEIVTGNTLQGMSLALRDKGERRRAIALQHEAIERLEQAGDDSNLARACNSLGTNLRALGDLDGARQQLMRAVTLARRIGDPGIEAMALNNTALVLAAQGRLADAEESFERSLTLRRERSDHSGVAAVLLSRAALRIGQGAYDAARADHAAALSALESVSAVHWVIEAHLVAARLALGDGDEARALEEAEAARALAEPKGLKREVLIATDLAARAGGMASSKLTDDDGDPGPWLAAYLTTRGRLREAEGDHAGADADFDRALGVVSDTPDGVVEARLLVERVTVDVARLDRQLDAEAPDLATVGDLVARMHRDIGRARALVSMHGLAPLSGRLDAAEERFGSMRHAGDVSGLAALAERVRDLERLADVGKALNTERDTQGLLDLVIDSAIDLTGAARGFLILYDGKAEEIRAARNISESSIHQPEFQISHSVARDVVLAREALRTDNAIDDQRLASAASISELRLLSILCVPLVFRDRALGAIYLDHPQVVGRFSEKHLATVSGLAEQAAIALENTRLSEGLKASNDELVASRAEVQRLNVELESRLERREAELEEVKESLDASRRALSTRFDYSSIVTNSPAMHRVLDQLDRVTDTDYPVIIQGESGTGKELIARAIHVNGSRSNHSILSINCAAIVEPLIESELFGAVKGAFTGADRDRKGLFEQADGGTLFLDEVGEMSMSVQSRLLRVLQDGEFLPVGGRTVRKVDVRVLCATHRDLRAMVGEGTFREDLFYRLAVATVKLPALRERPDDIGLLLSHFLREDGRSERAIEPAALALLRAYPWPGNVRQLQNATKNLLMFEPQGTVVSVESARHLLQTMQDVAPGDGPSTGLITPENDPERSLKERISEFERRLVTEALVVSEGNKSQASRLLGVPVRTLYKMIERLGL